MTQKAGNNQVHNKPLLAKADVSGSAIKPPIGLTPRWVYEAKTDIDRFTEVCGAITRYYDAGLKINPDWIEEYNELIDCVGEHFR